MRGKGFLKDLKDWAILNGLVVLLFLVFVFIGIYIAVQPVSENSVLGPDVNKNVGVAVISQGVLNTLSILLWERVIGGRLGRKQEEFQKTVLQKLDQIQEQMAKLQEAKAETPTAQVILPTNQQHAKTEYVS